MKEQQGGMRSWWRSIRDGNDAGSGSSSAGRSGDVAPSSPTPTPTPTSSTTAPSEGGPAVYTVGPGHVLAFGAAMLGAGTLATASVTYKRAEKQ